MELLCTYDRRKGLYVGKEVAERDDAQIVCLTDLLDEEEDPSRIVSLPFWRHSPGKGYMLPGQGIGNRLQQQLFS
jgi:hypothetical protein